MCFQLDLRGEVSPSVPDGASVCVEFPLGVPVVSAMTVKEAQSRRWGKGACAISTRCAHTPAGAWIPGDGRARGYTARPVARRFPHVSGQRPFVVS
ncbi:hypothetical protein GCM10010496_22320 [Streptomyces asoensis]|nr:hypothetical protein GCM10010496_22320 [Streptomyces asoensis]